MRELGVVIALLLAGCRASRDDGFPEALLRGCTGEQECWELKKQLAHHQGACAERRLPAAECQRLERAVARVAANDADAELRRAEERRRADERNARARDEAAAEERRAAEAKAWLELDLVACRAGEQFTCGPVADYVTRYPGTPNARDAENALAVGRVAAEARRTEQRARSLKEAEDFANAPLTVRPKRCCDGTTLSDRCVGTLAQGCCSRHKGVCP